MNNVTIKFWDYRGKKYVKHEDVGFGYDLAVNGQCDVYLIDYPETIELGYLEPHFYKDGERIA